MPSPEQLTPQERLAISRQALLRHMSRHRRPQDDETDAPGDAGAPQSGPAPGGTWSLIKSAARAWWHRHPASLAAELARPLLDDYAQAHPFKLLGFSAGAGAALVVIRPWRMVSMGVLLTALKSSGLSSALLSDLPRTVHPQATP
jgi:hypothetical protein